MPLSENACKKAQAEAKAYKLSDGQSLYLHVAPTAHKTWRFDFSFAGKRRTAVLGTWPGMSVADARERRAEIKAALRRGIDPFAKVDTAPELSLVGETFETVAKSWFEGRRAIWAPSYGNRIWARIEDDLLPDLGGLGVDRIEAPQVLATLRKVEARGAVYSAKRLRQMASEIFGYAIASGLATRDPAADVRKALRPLPRAGQRSALAAGQLPEFFAALNRYQGDRQTILALKLVTHTFVRSSELRLAEWTEFQGDVWVIPAERMKMRRQHLVPITAPAKSLLSELRTIAGDSKLVLPGVGGFRPISENTMIYAMYRLGYHSRATVHGFRATASTVLNESGLFRPDVIERQLAHVPANEVRAAYNRAAYLPERKEMMRWWSDYLERAEAKGRELDLSDLLK